MTGFLERMAARATGGMTSAQPQLPARFSPPDPVLPVDDAGGVVPGDGLRTPPVAIPTSLNRTADTVDNEPVGSAERRSVVQPARAAGPITPVHPVGQQQDDPAVAFVQDQTPGVSAGPPPPGPDPRPDPDPDPDPSLNPGAQRVTVGVAKALMSATLPATVAAIPVLPTLPEAGIASQLAQPQPPSQPHVVQISIGRVEVRAAVAPAAAASRPATEAKQPDQLSLRDYLDGRREVR